ncbi:MAG: HlyC/CorC family transporter [Armatimonadetes bacterium]|nr:HlyC/CorC family transporter [Armatimonadota bacterium]
MEESELILGVVVLLCMVFFCALFTASETALIALSRSRIKELLETGGKAAAALDRLTHDRGRFLLTALAACSLSSAVAVSLATYLSLRFIGGWLSIAGVALVALLLLFFGQVIPRKTAGARAERFSLFVAAPLEVILRPVKLMVDFFLFVSAPFLKLIEAENSAKDDTLTDEEIRMLVSKGKEERELEEEEREMIESIFTFGETSVKEIMVPRIDMVCVQADIPISKVLDIAIARGYSRFPVYEETIYNVIGIIYVKDLLDLVKDKRFEEPIRPKLRPAYYVPSSKKVDDLLREMQKEKISMAIVVDEYGGTDGLVTTEDLIEEIVGEITDEHDQEAPAVKELEDGSFLVDAKMHIEDANHLLDLRLHDGEGEFETLGGYVYGLMGRVPTQGEQVESDDFTITVAKIERQRIAQVCIRKKGEPKRDASAE